ncbi:Cupredoxin [Cerioporus squamosus]|nr:Cupredoxin [Cerioporus squamosus]
MGNKGDNFQINHWHGFFQKGTNWADGPALYCDGLRGPMVVYDPNDPHAYLYDVDDESTVITLSDWYHTMAKLGPAFPLGPDSVLINGLGRFAGGDANADLAVISVTQGKRYRFRLVSISCDPNFVFSIDRHNTTVIEADALTADQGIDNYWIRELPSGGTVNFDGGVNSAILRYDGAAEIEPVTNRTMSMAPLVESDLVPPDNPAAVRTPSFKLSVDKSSAPRVLPIGHRSDRIPACDYFTATSTHSRAIRSRRRSELTSTASAAQRDPETRSTILIIGRVIFRSAEMTMNGHWRDSTQSKDELC